MPVCIVTAHMISPVVARQPLHLDGMLLAAVVSDAHHLHRQSDLASIQYPRIPIARIDYRSTWAYLCSAWMFPPGAERGRENLAKRKDAEDIEARSARWMMGAGPERAQNIPLPTIETPTVHWYAIGTRRGLLDACERIKSVGPLRRQGYGRVSSWSVETTTLHPSSVLVDIDGRAARHLPAQWCTSGNVEQGSHVPPYWHPDLQNQDIVRHGQQCTLDAGIHSVLQGVR